MIEDRGLTLKKDSIGERIQCPEVGCPIRMTQAPRKRKEPRKKLLGLTPVDKGTQRHRGDRQDPEAQLDRVAQPNPKDGFRAHAVRSKEKDKIGRGQVEIDVLHAEQNGKQDAAREERRLFPRQHEGEHQDAVQEAIVLEMNVVDNQETRRKQDGQSSNMSAAPRRLWRCLDISGLVCQWRSGGTRLDLERRTALGRI